jgi:hypothetical protein
MNLFDFLFRKKKYRILLNLNKRDDCQNWFALTDQLRFKEKGSSAVISFDTDLGESTFSGYLNINQGAGFASYRIRKNLDLTDFKRIEIAMTGDGRRYKILIKDNAAVQNADDYSYQAEFKTTQDQLQIFSFDLKSFKSVRRGKEIFNVAPLNISEIVELGLQINDKNVGAYQLKFKNWVAKS